MGGGFAISALDATDPADSEYLSSWSDITVNIPDNPDAAWWCATEGNVIIDTNNNSKELVDALVGACLLYTSGETRLFDREPLDALKDRLDGTDTGFNTALSEKVENPPLPYNLTVLLSDMSRRYGFTAAKTQQITQDLRDKYKAITYNRSDSQYRCV